jgi:hypothetical protein
MTHSVIIDGVTYDAIKVIIVTKENISKIIFDDTQGAISFDSDVLNKVTKHMNACTEKFRRENPCPKCGSYNVDIDWGTPIICADCGYSWN